MLKKINSFLDVKQLVTNLVVAVTTVSLSVMAISYTSSLTGPLPISVTQTSTQKESSFQATGESEITTTPDEVAVTVGVIANGTTVAVAQDEANRVINTITEAVKELGIADEDIKTVNYNVNPDYNYQENFRGQDRIVGYSVYADLRIRTQELDIINEVIDAATTNGANQVSNIQFSLSSEKEAELKKEAREEAIANAKANAQELSRLAGMKLGKIINVIEHQNPVYPQPMMRAYAEDAGLGGGGEPTNIQPGSSTYTYMVTLSYETL